MHIIEAFEDTNIGICEQHHLLHEHRECLLVGGRDGLEFDGCSKRLTRYLESCTQDALPHVQRERCIGFIEALKEGSI